MSTSATSSPVAASKPSLSATVEERSRLFKAQFLLVASGCLVVASLAALGLGLATAPQSATVSSAIVVAMIGGLSFYLGYDGKGVLGSFVLTYGVSTVGAYAVVAGAVGTGPVMAAMMLMIPVLGFLAQPISALPLGAWNTVLFTSVSVYLMYEPLDRELPVINTVIGAVLMLSYVAIIWMFLRHVADASALLRARLEDIDAVVVRAHRIADGDLSGEVEGETDVSVVLRRMTVGLRDLVGHIRSTNAQLGSAASEIGAMTSQQSQATVEQSAAVEETRESLRSILGSSTDIAGSASEVLSNAERTVETSETVGARVSTLAAHTERVTEILDTIRDIANKAELLALNAALEGAKAGEAGRGFSLVASRMQGLAEAVLQSVKGIRTLTADIREATTATVLSLEQATKLARETAERSRKIALVCQQQRSSTEQVTQAMEDIAQASTSIAAGSDQTALASRDLAKLATDLTAALNRFSL